MRLNKIYNIIVNDIIVSTGRNFNAIMKEFAEIRKSEPKAWVQTCYC